MRSLALAPLLLALGAAAAPPSPAPPKAAAVLPWVEDDVAKALADGKAKKLPIFVEAWAPW